MARRGLAVAVTVAVAAALLPGQPYGEPAAPIDPEAFCRAEEARNPGTLCSVFVVDSDARPAPVTALAFQPRATGLATDGVPGCVRGASRPVVGTTTPRLDATFDRMPADVTFELRPPRAYANSSPENRRP
ncbi:hypothetical protein GCM10010168_63150 [Actinoplanes ianthinogenes]|uniref:Uncharacterized protein n=2 Tax=Actinoplanes ianthinogenes TaxID=122358 RepID=A0ABM7LJK2_9ACTN|nr:hypothetical protein Aiant_00940 [Actinoplanes ianthinogenes]GGR36110.1 hypothetical protein GCM10010168_63150 [Actinoplanes ianthinogenes]